MEDIIGLKDKTGKVMLKDRENLFSFISMVKDLIEGEYVISPFSLVGFKRFYKQVYSLYAYLMVETTDYVAINVDIIAEIITMVDTIRYKGCYEIDSNLVDKIKEINYEFGSYKNPYNWGFDKVPLEITYDEFKNLVDLGTKNNIYDLKEYIKERQPNEIEMVLDGIAISDYVGDLLVSDNLTTDEFNMVKDYLAYDFIVEDGNEKMVEDLLDEEPIDTALNKIFGRDEIAEDDEEECEDCPMVKDYKEQIKNLVQALGNCQQNWLEMIDKYNELARKYNALIPLVDIEPKEECVSADRDEEIEENCKCEDCANIKYYKELVKAMDTSYGSLYQRFTKIQKEYDDVVVENEKLKEQLSTH